MMPFRRDGVSLGDNIQSASEASAKKRSVLLALDAEPAAPAARGPRERHVGVAAEEPAVGTLPNSALFLLSLSGMGDCTVNRNHQEDEDPEEDGNRDGSAVTVRITYQ